MVFKFLNRGKKSEFFLEAPPLSHEAEPATKLAEVKQEVQKVAEAAVDELKETMAKVADAVEEKLEKAAPAAAKPASTKAKKLKKTKSEAKPEGQPASPKPAAAQPAAVTNFATDFLMPSPTPRRRPGPSMDMFRDMAKDVNPRK